MHLYQSLAANTAWNFFIILLSRSISAVACDSCPSSLVTLFSSFEIRLESALAARGGRSRGDSLFGVSFLADMNDDRERSAISWLRTSGDGGEDFLLEEAFACLLLPGKVHRVSPRAL